MFIGPFPNITNSADWQESVEVRAFDDNSVVDLTDGYLIEMTVFQDRVDGISSGYGSDWYACSSPVLTASTDDGKIIASEDGYFTFRFPKEAMGSVIPGTYGVSLRISKNDEYDILALSSVSIVYGGFGS